MEYVILFVFFISIIWLVIGVLRKYGFNGSSFMEIFLKIYRLRGLFFCIFYIYVSINMMKSVDNDGKWYLLSFIICGIAMILCMYKKTRKIGSCIFVGTFIGGFFIIMPLMGMSNGDTRDALFFVIIGIILGYFVFREILKEK